MGDHSCLGCFGRGVGRVPRQFCLVWGRYAGTWHKQTAKRVGNPHDVTWKDWGGIQMSKVVNEWKGFLPYRGLE